MTKIKFIFRYCFLLNIFNLSFSILSPAFMLKYYLKVVTLRFYLFSLVLNPLTILRTIATISRSNESQLDIGVSNLAITLLTTNIRSPIHNRGGIVFFIFFRLFIKFKLSFLSILCTRKTTYSCYKYCCDKPINRFLFIFHMISYGLFPLMNSISPTCPSPV